MVAPTLISLAADLAALTARVAALETQTATNTTKIADLDVSDAASGWKTWRQQKGGS